MDINTIVVGIYFLFLIAIGWIFRTSTSNTRDYFRGGGKMLWWMVGLLLVKSVKLNIAEV